MGNPHVRFLEGWAPAMAPSYSTKSVPEVFHKFFERCACLANCTFPIRAARLHCCAFLIVEEDMGVQRALISVFDKTGILEFAKRLAALKIEILSTGGTAKLLRE